MNLIRSIIFIHDESCYGPTISTGQFGKMPEGEKDMYGIIHKDIIANINQLIHSELTTSADYLSNRRLKQEPSINATPLTHLRMTVAEFSNISVHDEKRFLKSVIERSVGINCIESAELDQEIFYEENPAYHQREPKVEDDRFSAIRYSNSLYPEAEEAEPYWQLDPNNPYGLNMKEWSSLSTIPVERKNNDVLIAVIDNGCSVHYEYHEHFWRNDGETCDDLVDNDKNGLADDCHGWNFANNNADFTHNTDDGGHGTEVSGIILARNDGRGVDGICPSCKLMCLKFIDNRIGRVTNQIKALNYAISKGARVSNNSYGGYGFSNAEYQGLRRATALGHIVVASAGNRGRNNDLFQKTSDIHTPSDYNLPFIVSVGASNSKGHNSAFSNYGKKSVDIHAPGADIVTTAKQFHYRSVNGTSFAAPMITGTIGLIWSEYPSLKPEQVIQSLSCRKVEQLKEANACGGTLDIYQSMQRASQFHDANTIGSSSNKLRDQRLSPYVSRNWRRNRGRNKSD